MIPARWKAIGPKFGRDDELQPWGWGIAYALTLYIPPMLILHRGAVDVAACLIVGLFFRNSICLNRWQWLRDVTVRFGITAWLWLIVVSLMAIDVKASLGTAVPWIRYVLLFAAMRHWVLKDVVSLKFLGDMLAIMLAYVAFDTYWQYCFGISLSGHTAHLNYRLTGPMENVKVGVYTAKMLLPCIGLGLYFALLVRSRLRISLMFLLLFACEIMILLSGERTAFLRSMMALLTAGGMLFLKEPRARLTSAALAVILVICSWWLMTTQPAIIHRLEEFKGYISSFWQTSYGQLWQGAMELGRTHPGLGLGLKGFRAFCPALQDQNILTYCDLHPHNTYLEWFAETGIVGVLLYIAMIGSLVVTSWRSFIAQQGIYRILPAVMMGMLMLCYFPIMVTQSAFSNWPALLQWYTLSVTVAALNLLPGKSK